MLDCARYINDNLKNTTRRLQNSFIAKPYFLRGLNETAARKDKLAAERILQLSLIKSVARLGLATLFSKRGNRLRFVF